MGGAKGERTDLKVVLVGERVGDVLNQRDLGQDLLAHLVHGSLDGGGVVLGEGAHGGIAGALPGSVKLGDDGPDSVDGAEICPFPGGINVGGKDAIPGLAEGGVLVAVEAVEGGAGGLKYGEALDAGGDGEALVAAEGDLDVARLGAVAEEGVGVGLAVNDHARPAVGDDLDVGGMDVRVGSGEVVGEDGAEELGGSNRVLLGRDCRG